MEICPVTIVSANLNEGAAIKSLVDAVIFDVYPSYYPNGVVKYFQNLHDLNSINADIEEKKLYVAKENDVLLGTITINENHICRLFVSSDRQRQGIGSKLLAFSELKIKGSSVCLDASLPALSFYEKRGYKFVSHESVVVDHESVLVWDVMEKLMIQDGAFYNGRTFISISNTDNGEVDDRTVFHYHQNNEIVWAEYSGGSVLKGFLLGTMNKDQSLKFMYQHINEDGILRIGECISEPQFLENGSLIMKETWRWLNGDCSEGISLLKEE